MPRYKDHKYLIQRLKELKIKFKSFYKILEEDKPKIKKLEKNDLLMEFDTLYLFL